MRTTLSGAAAAMLATFVASAASAEPVFLSKQYTRCTACHYSPTGGGLLTSYGRLLSHRELSMTGSREAAPAAGAEDDPRGEQAPVRRPSPMLSVRCTWGSRRVRHICRSRRMRKVGRRVTRPRGNRT
jgi:hypothetical protein